MESSMNISCSSDCIDDKYQSFLYDNKHDKSKKQYLNTLKKFKDRGNLPNVDFSHKSSLYDLKKIYKTALYEDSKKFKYQFFKHLVWLFTYSVEQIMKIVGKGEAIDGWSASVWRNIDDFKLNFNQMTDDIQVEDVETGNLKYIKNPSILNQITVNPWVGLITSLIKSFITYSTLRNVHTIADFLTKNQDKVTTDDLSKLKL